MVLCLLALPVFAVLGIFSLQYRQLAKDALGCLFKTVTLRKCESGLDDRIRAGITGRLLPHSERAAAFFYHYYKIFSWIVLLVFLWSAYTSVTGVYNYVQYGNCNGPASTGFCLFDPLGQYSGTSSLDVDAPLVLIPPVVEEDDPFLGGPTAELTIIEFGCYSCPYTKKAEPTVQRVLEEYAGRVNVQFKTFLLPSHSFSYPAALAANCVAEQGQYAAYHVLLFERQETFTNTTFRELAALAGVNLEQYDACVAEERYKAEIQADTLMGLQAGVQGTPTFFIEDQIIVGPKPFKTFETILERKLDV